MILKNMMKEYLGRDYSDNYLRNFCIYWMKGRESLPAKECTKEGGGRFRKWRQNNDLDCLYFDGDLRADTLMSAWTPIKWVADCVNKEKGMKFYKSSDNNPNYYLKLLAENRDKYLPPKHELVLLLDRFLELAELRCNYILLPDSKMNAARYKCIVNGKIVMLYDEVPGMLYHIYQKESLGRFFLDKNGNLDCQKIETWILAEHLCMGFKNNDIHSRKENSNVPEILPLTRTLHPAKGRWLTKHSEIKEALQYMIRFLEQRNRIKFLEK
ncbi:hypothetical protein ACQRBK_01040 [Peptoniphilaceae bacterium SGI.137]